MRHGFCDWRRTLLGVLTVFSMCVSHAISGDNPPLYPALRIRINAPGVVGLAPLYLAMDKGYFSEEGLNVEFADGVAQKGGMEIAAALVEGKLDIATIAPSAALFDALAGGAPLTGIYVLNTVTPSDTSSGIVVRRDLIDSGRYKSVKDLKGMRIAISAVGSSAHYNVAQALRHAGLSAADAEFVALPFSDALAALGGSSIDAAFEVEPFVSSAQSRGIARLVVPSSETSRGAPSVLVYGNADFVAKHRVGVERYVYALLRGQRDYLTAVNSGVEKAELYRTLVKYTSMREMAQLAQLHLPTVDPNGAFDARAMEDMQSFFVETGRQRNKLNGAQIIDVHFAVAAVERLDRPR